MKLPCFPVLAVLFLLPVISSCGGGGGDSSRNVIVNPPEPPRDGISGVVQSRIRGAQVSVTDASGQQLTVASGNVTSASGMFDLVFSEFAIEQGINAPLIITVDGSGAEAVCDYNRAGENDCQNADGTFVSYGNTYTLADNFTLRGVVPTFPPQSTAGDRRVEVKVSAASDIAVSFILDNGETTLSADAVNLAAAQSLGFVEFITGLSTGGEAINDISLPDLSRPDLPLTGSLAVGLFAAGLHGQVFPTVAARANYRRVLNEIEARLKVNPATSQVESTGHFLSDTVNNYLTAAISFQNSLTTASPVLAGANSSQLVTLQLLAALGGNTVAIATPADPDSDAPLERSKTLVNRLTAGIGATLLISDSETFAGTTNNAATVYSDQVSLLAALASREVRNTLLLLDEALAEAQATGETQLTGTNVTGVLEFDDDLVTIATATSTTSNIRTGTSINLTIQNGRRSNPGGNGQFNIDDLTIAVTRTINDATTQQLIEGSITIIMDNAADGADAVGIQYQGDLRAISGLEFTGNLALENMSPVDSTEIDADYEASFSFPDQSDLGMSGSLLAGINTYTVATDDGVIVADLETNIITDMSAEINLTLNAGGTVATGGVLTAAGAQTGILDSNGIVAFDDGTSIVLPAPIR